MAHLIAAVLRACLLAAICMIGGAGAVRAQPFDLTTASVADINRAMDAGGLSAEQLVRLYLARIEAYNEAGPRIAAVIAVNPDALEQARALDAERRAKGRRGPLHGVPVIVKDNIDTAEMPTTGGSMVLAGYRPSVDAPIVRRLRDAGAIILGKANLDDFAAGGSGFSSVFGQTRNPHDPAYTPLGSSGGSGAGLAARFATLALGTDTGGSLRSPSSVNGVYGLKPTRGLLSRTGIIPTCYSFDAVGPMARSAADLAAMLGAMTGPEPGDSDTRASTGLHYADYRGFLGQGSLKGLRIGVIKDATGADPEVDRLFDEAVERLKATGAEVVEEVSYPPQVLNGATRAAIVKVVCDTEKAVYFDEYLGKLPPAYPHTLAELAERGLALTTPHAHPVIYRGLARRVHSGQGMDSLAYLSAKQHGIEMVRMGVLGLLEAQRLDLLVYPTRPHRPHPINPQEPETGRSAAPLPPGAKPFGVGLTNIANITGFPELVAPAGLTDEGLPVSISFFGPAFSEPRLLQAAYAYQLASPALPLPPSTPALPGEVIEAP